jgi:hypothetical protein
VADRSLRVALPTLPAAVAVLVEIQASGRTTVHPSPGTDEGGAVGSRMRAEGELGSVDEEERRITSTEEEESGDKAAAGVVFTTVHLSVVHPYRQLPTDRIRPTMRASAATSPSDQRRKAVRNTYSHDRNRTHRKDRSLTHNNCRARTNKRLNDSHIPPNSGSCSHNLRNTSNCFSDGHLPLHTSSSSSSSSSNHTTSNPNSRNSSNRLSNRRRTRSPRFAISPHTHSTPQQQHLLDHSHHHHHHSNSCPALAHHNHHHSFSRH